MKSVYTRDRGVATADPPDRRRGVGVVKPIESAKEAVTVEELAERLAGPGVRRGREVAFRCLLHDDHDPSLRVDPEHGVWFCDPCAVGGDVVELARRAWGHPDDGRGAAEAAAMLLMEFGHEVPQRPPSWFRKQERQKPIRDALAEAQVRHVQRRLFRVFLLPEIQKIEDPFERAEEYSQAWDDLRGVAALVVSGRRSS